MKKQHALKVLEMGIDTQQEPVVFIREDCHICRSEGFNASNRVLIQNNGNSLHATLNVVSGDVLPEGYAGFSKVALARLPVLPGDEVYFSHPPVVNSLSAMRKKIFGQTLTEKEITTIVEDISEHRYRDVEIASFLSVCAGGRLSVDEIIGLTKAMVKCGKKLTWGGQNKVFDKHCVGGVPGNRTTPLVVSIASAAGLMIPKTSSRAITSPAGTADTMEVLTDVNLSLDKIQEIVSQTGACLAWGGAVNLSPADDLFIRIERALDIDGEGQLIASMLSKKIAAGSTHAIIDIPLGETAKVRTQEQAEHLAGMFYEVGMACGIQLRCIITDGSKPVGYGIGPAEEAKDIVAVLECDPKAPKDLRKKSILLAANLIDLATRKGMENCIVKATELLDSGQALAQFNKIINAQGGRKEIPKSGFVHNEILHQRKKVKKIDNRKLARLAKLAGAPHCQSAGIRLHANVGEEVLEGEPLFSILAGSSGELDYALQYYQNNPDIYLFD